MKNLNAQQLLNFLTELASEGTDLANVSINFRTDSDSDVLQCNYVEEDLYDEQTNSELTSIIFTTTND